jgi:hypothetical protein
LNIFIVFINSVDCASTFEYHGKSSNLKILSPRQQNATFGNYTIETCYSFYDIYSTFYPDKKCSTSAPVCCGTCQNRYCCSTPAYKLNQSACSSDSKYELV